MAALLGSLLEAGAQEQAAALLRRDPAAHVSLDDGHGVAELLDALLEADAEEQFMALVHRAASLGDPAAVAALLDVGVAGALEQATALAARAADGVSLGDWRAGAAHVENDKLRAQAFNLFFHCRAHVETTDDRAQTASGGDGLQSGDTRAHDQNSRGRNGSGRRGHHRKEARQSASCENHGLVSGN